MTRSITAVRTVPDLRNRVGAWREAGRSIALVPTMGALHDGHLSLIALAKEKADEVVVSIFLNPLQFGPREDLARYPRDEAGDIAKLGSTVADLAYIPSAAEMYPPGFSTTVDVSDISEDLCGASRPNHFNGVATVVAKLLMQCDPDLAVFGEKDYQQLLVIRRMVRDLDIPVEILGGPIAREADGLALSTRNAYLSPDERKKAPILFETIRTVAADLEKGRGADDAALSGRFKLEAAGFRVDYVAVRDPDTLRPLNGPVRRARVLCAVHLGATRLIDNVPVPAG
jgi:pantoate--beta-alanine ligase